MEGNTYLHDSGVFIKHHSPTVLLSQVSKAAGSSAPAFSRACISRTQAFVFRKMPQELFYSLARSSFMSPPEKCEFGDSALEFCRVGALTLTLAVVDRSALAEVAGRGPWA